MKRKLLFAVMTLITGAWSLSANAQEDITSQYLTNANLTSLTGWTQSGYTDWKTDGAVPVIEFWNWSNQFNFSQTVTLPAGNYRIAVNAFYRNSWTGNGTNNNMAWIFAGDKTQNVVALNSMSDLSGYAGSNDLYRAATAFSQGKFSNEFDFDLTEDATIELGFRGTCPNGGWCILGPVKLYKYSLDDYLVDYRAKVAEAQALNEADMFPTAWSNLQAAIVDESTFSLVSEVTAAINTLSAAINAANASIAAKSSVGTKLAHMKEVVDATNFYTDALVESYYGQWKAKYDAGTITEAEANALEDPFVQTGHRAANTVDDLLLPAWTIGGTQCANYDTDLYINGWSVEGNTDGSNFKTPFFEYWTGDNNSLNANTLQATVVGLTPDQLYSVELLARVRQTNNQTKVANSITMQVGDGTPVDITQGARVGTTPFYFDTFTAIGKADASGNLVLSINVAAGSNVSWLSFKNAKYTELEDERIPYAEQLAQVVAQAQSLAPTLIVPDGVKTTLTNTAATYDGYTYTSLPTVAAFQEAIATVQAAITDAQAAEATYAKYTELKGYATQLLAVDYVDLVADAHATYAAAVTEPTLNTKADIDAAYEALYTATMTYVANADPAAGEQFDLTFLLTNPDVTSYWTGTWGVVPAGWYTDQNPADNFQVMGNEEMGPGGEVFIEYWSATAKTSNFVLYQKATLPEGTYQMTGRVGLLQADGNGTTANMTFSANDTDGSQIAVGPLSDQSVEFINSTTQEVKIGLKAQAGNNYRWIGINKIKMYKIPTDNTEFAINVDATNATVNVTVEGVAAAAAKKLDAVSYTVAVDEGCALTTHTITYMDGENNTQTITPTDLGSNTFTFQMPAYDVTITVMASVDKTALNEAIAAATIVEGSVPTSVYTPYATALSTAQTVAASDVATVAEVAAATEALTQATATAATFVEPYTAYLELKAIAEYNRDAESDAEDTAKQDFATAITTAQNAADAATTATEVETANTNLKDAMDYYVNHCNPVNTGKFNLTYMLTNPDLTPFYTGQHGVHPDGWATEQADGNYQVIPSEDAANPDGIHKYCYEYWSNPAKTNGVFNLYTSVNLVAGTYQMSCYAFAQDQAGTNTAGVYFYANDTQGSQVTNTTLTQQSVEFVNTETQDVKIGLKPTSTNTYNWMGIGYLELYKVPAKSYEVGGDTWDITTDAAGDVTLNRSIQNGWNAYILPFNMTQAEVETYFGAGAQVKLVKEYIAETEKLKFETIDGLRANVPCLIKATTAAAAGTVIPARTIVPASATEVVYEGTNVTMTGCYADETNVPKNGIFVQNAKLVYNSGNGTGDSYVYSTRAYIELNGWTPGAQGIKGLNIDFGDDEATGIATIENGELKIYTGKAYDLSGREVKNPTKGLYIIDGKKVFLK